MWSMALLPWHSPWAHDAARDAELPAHSSAGESNAWCWCVPQQVDLATTAGAPALLALPHPCPLVWAPALGVHPRDIAGVARHRGLVQGHKAGSRCRHNDSLTEESEKRSERLLGTHDCAVKQEELPSGPNVMANGSHARLTGVTWVTWDHIGHGVAWDRMGRFAIAY